MQNMYIRENRLPASLIQNPNNELNIYLNEHDWNFCHTYKIRPTTFTCIKKRSFDDVGKSKKVYEKREQNAIKISIPLEHFGQKLSYIRYEISIFGVSFM